VRRPTQLALALGNTIRTQPAAITTGPIPNVLGLDLSLTSTGLAGDGWTDTITHPPRHKRDDRTDYTHTRLADITTRLDDYLTGVTLAVIEDAAYGSPDAGHQLAGLRWIIRHRLWRRGIAYALVPPTVLKMYTVDNGGASKEQMVAAVAAWFPWFAGGADEADAAALRALGRHWLGAPVVPDPPRLAEVLAGCEWPDRARVMAT
jgi:Holliday junction resolvasome RuvABC endonuclease subunit